MSEDMFLKIDGVKGTAKTAGHADEIQIRSMSWGMTQPGSGQTGAALTAGKADVQDVIITKTIDRSSPALVKLCCNGETKKEATFTARQAGGKKPIDYLKIKLKNVFVSKFTNRSEGVEIIEEVVLKFKAFEYEFVPAKEDGSPDGAIPASWNIVTGAEK